MGWPLSLAFCQAVTMRAAEEAGFGPDEAEADRRTGVVLGPTRRCCVAGYVDNVGVVALSRQEAWDGAESIRLVLERKGPRVHPAQTSDSCIYFLGLEINIPLATVRVRPQRAFRLRA